ncbi:MAG: DnaT-like ssDNA-binding protein [Planctomycetota bacterium]
MTTIISTFGAPDANSYASLTQADSLLAVHAIDPSAWTDAGTPARGAALLCATLDVDAVPWLGERARTIDPDQALAFPRSAIGLPSRLLAMDVSDALVAQEAGLALACSLHALALLERSKDDSHEARRCAGVTRHAWRLGELSEDYTYARKPAGSFSALAPPAQAVLSDFPRARRISRS